MASDCCKVTSSWTKPMWAGTAPASVVAALKKTIVVDIKERGGDIRAEKVPDARKDTLRSLAKRNVEPGAVVSTDEFASYGLLEPDGFKHGQVRHTATEWACYDAGMTPCMIRTALRRKRRLTATFRSRLLAARVRSSLGDGGDGRGVVRGP
jgi:transposase-like protein